MLHLPGLRGNPQRTYPIIPLGPNFTNFSGTFENYTASVIHYWQKNKQQEKLDRLNQDLTRLGLTNKIVARQLTSAHVELLVNRLLRNQDGAEDLVNIVDVGFGVSQAVPIVVALHMAEPGQLVYIEQPEIHLHPRAQTVLAEVLADAALQGKHIVIETHSDLILSGIQTRVAEGKLPPELVKLHWFEQLADGFTKITSADLDEAGAFGDWPEDFHKVILAAENRYLDAAETHLMGE
jgi:predicted ATPase